LSSTLRLGEHTEVSFPQLVLLSTGSRASTVEVASGTIELKFRDKGKEEFRLRFADREIQFRRSAELRARVGRDQAEIRVRKGEVRIQENGEELVVRKNETVSLDLGDSKELAGVLQEGAESSDESIPVQAPQPAVFSRPASR
jgi:hypothetical protein